MRKGKHLIGIIPAAGKGTRVAPLPGAKELFPIGFGEIDSHGQKRKYPKVVSQYLIDQMTVAGVEHIYMVISEDKADILRYYGSGKRFGARLAYLVVDELIGMPYTLNAAYPLVKDATVFFGMPDTIFQPANAFSLLLEQHQTTQADLTLGLFPTNQPWRFGMVEYDADHRLLACVDKPAHSDLKFMWGNACWGPQFSAFLNDEIETTLSKGTAGREIVLGDYFSKAVNAGLNVRVHPFHQGEYIDIGSPEDLVRAVNLFGKKELELKK
ncbi:MAG: sugar phosphate nucleotidyltransferase [Anaerolineales bacterium]